MGRTKNNTNTKSNFISSIGYSGKVTVTVKSGKNTISKHTYKNGGGLNLWYFICAALAGQYTSAERYRPTRIVLYYCKEPNVPTDISDLNASEKFTKLTGEISINRATEVLPIKSGSKTVNYAATLHFLIPPVYFNALSNDDKISINTVVLYGKNIPTNIQENPQSYSAYYFFSTLDQNGNNVWDTKNILKLKDIKDNYNVIIDWEMSVDNK